MKHCSEQSVHYLSSPNSNLPIKYDVSCSTFVREHLARTGNGVAVKNDLCLFRQLGNFGSLKLLSQKANLKKPRLDCSDSWLACVF